MIDEPIGAGDAHHLVRIITSDVALRIIACNELQTESRAFRVSREMLERGLLLSFLANSMIRDDTLLLFSDDTS